MTSGAIMVRRRTPVIRERIPARPSAARRTAPSLILALLLGALPAFAQLEDAKQALDRGDLVRAVTLLTDALAQRPTADAFLYLGSAYRQMKEYEKAEDTLNDGNARFPADPRFHLELASVFEETRDIDKAKAELRQALVADPHNAEASDRLAAIDLSEGEIEAALRFWNKSDRPVIDDILHNYYLSFGSWVVRDSIAFGSASILHYSQWKTTEARLFQTNNFTNIGLEVEPTTIPDHFNAVVRTTSKTNRLGDVLFSLLKATPISTLHLDLWNLGNSGLNWNSLYRWDTDRRKVEGLLHIPIPIPGILNLEISDTWRSERWDVSPSVRPEYLPEARFDYRSNRIRIEARHIPQYRFEIGGGLDYSNRYARGDIPELGTDSRNSARLFADTSIRLADGRYKNRLNLRGFAARKSILGDFSYTGGTAELSNRLTISKDSRTYFDWSLKGGTLRGNPPLEDYFVLGLDTDPDNLLRGHTVADHGRYGKGPTGTDFVLGNFDIERRFVTIPMFDTFNLPYIMIKGQAFFDTARSWDRTRIFKPSRLLMDTGGEIRFETPASSLSLVYGRSLRDGKAVLFGYIEHKLW